MESLLLLTLGWLFGLLGPRIVEEINKPYRRKEFKRSIISELEDLKCKLASVSLILHVQSATLDKPFLDWIQPIISGDQSFYFDPKILEVARELSKLEDEQLITASKAYKTIKIANQGLKMKKYSMPFLSANINSLQFFSLDIQRSLLEIRERISYLNEEIDAAWFHYSKTFESSVSRENYLILQANVEQGYKEMAYMTRNLADHISKVILSM